MQLNRYKFSVILWIFSLILQFTVINCKIKCPLRRSKSLREPVCGSDGISYYNRFDLYCKAKNSELELSQVHAGMC